MKLTQYKSQQLFSKTARNATIWYSYITPIAVFDSYTNHLYITTAKYSSTTSKHLNTFIKESNYSYKTAISEQEMIELVESVLDSSN